LPDPDLVVAMYVRQEAVLSSQIEGAQSSLDDVLTFELDPTGREVPRDVPEVVNHVNAMNHGLRRMALLPPSLQLIAEIHGMLLAGVRGAARRPGEFRALQNGVGAGNVPLAHAALAPPPTTAMWDALGNLERFLHADDELPVLVRRGLAYPQFETIRPFLDGSGRFGRPLITFLLCHRGVLHRPILVATASNAPPHTATSR
jgi:Fic family protein